MQRSQQYSKQMSNRALAWLRKAGGGAALALLGALLLVSAGGCQNGAPPVDESTMRTVLVDLHLGEARPNAPAVDARPPPDSLLARHGLSRAQFEAAHAYYAERPSVYRDIYQEVVDSLRAIQGDVAGLRGAYEAATEEAASDEESEPENASPRSASQRERR
ncbi:MAG: DUF4296 domain-containing protein [Longimonas sp.]|uniref:DUF4296 domain-containing protein n=1 Tax=Longimonas sp. TaxID=2039626 RepID=UPI00335589C7